MLTKKIFQLFLCLAGITLSTYSRAQSADPWQFDTLRIALLGDSNLWIGGDACDCPRGWSTWMRRQLSPAACVSLARSGATWTHTARTRMHPRQNVAVLTDDNVIYNQVIRLRDSIASGSLLPPHVVLIAAGTNDAWFARRRPGIDSLSVDEAFRTPATPRLIQCLPAEVTSLAQCVRYSCELLRSFLPEVRIVLLTPPFSTAVADEAIARRAQTVAACARQLHADVIRLDRPDLIHSATERRSRCYTTDGTHTSVEGAKRIAAYVSAQLRDLLSSPHGQ